MKITTLSAWLLLLTACGGSTAQPAARTPGEAVARVAAQSAGESGRGRRQNTNSPAQVRDRPAGTRPSSEVLRVRIDPGPGPRRGAAQPLVTIVEFTDFECPYCQRVQSTLARLLREHPGEVQLVVRHNPLAFHSNAIPAAELALEANAQGGADLFWRMHDLLFENNRALSRAELERHASLLGMDLNAVRHALDTHSHLPQITADQQAAAAIGARGTPTFFLNGRQLLGAQPYEQFQQIVAEELQTARDLMRQGVGRDQLYAHLQRGASAAPPPAPPRRAPPRPSPDRIYVIPVPPNAPTRGPQGAPVTLQLFSDFQCPFCNRVRPALDQVVARFGGQVRIVWRDYPLPFHHNAMPAAEAAREVFSQAGDDAFWRYHDLLFENQRNLETDVLVQLAGTVPGVNPAQVRAALMDHRHEAGVRADMQAIQTAGARIGTPSSFINGRLLQGAQPFAAFEAAIQRALSNP